MKSLLDSRNTYPLSLSLLLSFFLVGLPPQQALAEDDPFSRGFQEELGKAFARLLIEGGKQIVKETRSSLSFEGSVGYEYSTSTGVITLSADRIQNDGWGTTNKIKIRLFATRERYAGSGGISGWVLGQYIFRDHLESNYGYPDVEKSVSLTPPPAGHKYYLTLVLLEMSEDGDYLIQDYRNFDEPVYF